MEINEIEIRVLRPNNGEIDGMPRNPRKISKKQLEKLKKSLEDAPEMLRLRELIVIPHGGEYVVIAGNQRLEAAKALGWEKLPCKVLPADTDPAKLREYAIKDNLPFGEDDWEVIASDWDTAELEDWGMSVSDIDSGFLDIKEVADFSTTFDFRLVCKDKEEMEDLQGLLRTTGKKMKYANFRELFENRGR